MDLLYQVKPCVQEETLLWEGEPVLEISSQRPEFSALDPKAAKRINRYYHRAETLFLRRCRTRLYQRAGADLVEKRAVSRPFTPWKASLSFALEEASPLLYVTLCYTLCQGEEASHVNHRSERWDLATGFPGAEKV